MGIVQITLDPQPPPSVKQANVGKSAPNHPGKPLHPRATWEKVPQTILASLTGNAYMETTHFKKGLPFFIRINGKASHKRHVHIQNTFGGVILTLDTC